MTRAVHSLRLLAVLAAFGALTACAVSPPAPGLHFDQQYQAPPNTFRG